MEIYKEILADILQKEGLHISLGISNLDISKVIESECYRTLQKIRDILDDDSLSDPACFYKIDNIVTAFYKSGIYTPRHDFG